MKTVYLVRHGQTATNAAKAYTGPEEPLSELGLRQVASVAERFKDETVERIISSPLTRARQTAGAFESVLGRRVTFSDLFVEAKGPTALHGKPAADPDAARVHDLVIRHWGDASWKHSDEENFYDLSERARQALAYLENQPEEHLLVVTHANFMRMLLYLVLLGDLLAPEMTVTMRKGLIVGNTGVTVLELNEWGKWKLLRWNDTLHLGAESESR
jgi:broad specificity phosphatase PhoE